VNIGKQLQHGRKKVDNRVALEVGKCRACAHSFARSLSYSSTFMQEIYRLRDKFKTLGSVCSTPKAGHPKTSMTEENKMSAATSFVNSPKKNQS